MNPAEQKRAAAERAVDSRRARDAAWARDGVDGGVLRGGARAPRRRRACRSWRSRHPRPRESRPRRWASGSPRLDEEPDARPHRRRRRRDRPGAEPDQGRRRRAPARKARRGGEPQDGRDRGFRTKQVRHGSGASPCRSKSCRSGSRRRGAVSRQVLDRLVPGGALDLQVGSLRGAVPDRWRPLHPRRPVGRDPVRGPNSADRPQSSCSASSSTGSSSSMASAALIGAQEGVMDIARGTIPQTRFP